MFGTAMNGCFVSTASCTTRPTPPIATLIRGRGSAHCCPANSSFGKRRKMAAAPIPAILGGKPERKRSSPLLLARRLYTFCAACSCPRPSRAGPTPPSGCARNQNKKAPGNFTSIKSSSFSRRRLSTFQRAPARSSANSRQRHDTAHRKDAQSRTLLAPAASTFRHRLIRASVWHECHQPKRVHHPAGNRRYVRRRHVDPLDRDGRRHGDARKRRQRVRRRGRDRFHLASGRAAFE